MEREEQQTEPPTAETTPPKVEAMPPAVEAVPPAAEAVPRVTRRPILDVGIALSALVVVALIVLTTTHSIGIFGPEPNADPTLGAVTGYGVAPWPEIAALTLAFTLPAVVCAVAVILRDVELSRGVRYLCFSLASVYFAAVATLSVLAAAGPYDAPATSANFARLATLTSGWGLAATGAFGALLGLSLPSVHKTTGPEDSLPLAPARSRRRATFYVLGALVVAIVAYTVCAAGWFGEDSPAGWIRDFLAIPAMAALAACLGVAIAGRFVEVPAFPERARHVMVALPLMAGGALAVVALASGVPALPGDMPWVVLLLVAFAALGTLPGLVIAAQRD